MPMTSSPTPLHRYDDMLPYWHSSCRSLTLLTTILSQPGRGSGHKWDADNCSSVAAAAKRDGLIPAGTVLPTKGPATGHYIALLIWPETYFHWIRMDSTKFWSHKPGQEPVRDVDDNGAKITDPSKADFSPWTQFCGYFVSVPSNITINWDWKMYGISCGEVQLGSSAWYT